MKVNHDRSVDAAYIKFAETDEVTSFGFSYSCDAKEVGGQINLNFDATGRLVGIEVLQASEKLPSSLLTNSEQ